MVRGTLPGTTYPSVRLCNLWEDAHHWLNQIQETHWKHTHEEKTKNRSGQLAQGGRDSAL
jgi:hypothetical protein